MRRATAVTRVLFSVLLASFLMSQAACERKPTEPDPGCETCS